MHTREVIMEKLHPTLWRTGRMLSGNTRLELFRRVVAHPDQTVSELAAQVGISLPRTSYAMASAGYGVTIDQIQPGDLIVSYGGGHVAMYIGNGQIVHSQDYSTGVLISPLSSQSIIAIRRVA